MAVGIAVVGSITVERDGIVVGESRLGGRQARLLLAYLVCERHRAVPRQELAEVLWPEEFPQSWESALRGVLSKVRAALGAAGRPDFEVLTVAFGCYQLRLPADTVVDIEVAASMLETAERALRHGALKEACEEASAVRTIAARPFLAGEEGPWVERIREQLVSRRL
ncbi:MAG: winged helix-turn-helix domain-containing protein, partial [Actinobacteria bacterium]|nr:winged helix-turn-helix domain-containing protein [Actinomycetota bacterium]